jgi:replicative DNA helicase
MKVETGKDFGYLDSEFQYRLLKQILVDRKFAETIISILNPSYFTVENLRFIAAEIRNSYETLGSIPDIGSLKIRIHEKFKGETNKFALEIKLDTLNKVSESDANDPDYIKDLSLKFCKQQELSRAISEIQTILDRGYVDDYDKASDIIRQALEVGQSTEDDTSVFDDIESVLAKDFREPIPTGIHLLDQYMNGGLAKGELGIILAAFGVGKTTAVTKIANTAFNEGKTVIQIFFEDQPNVIKRKHISCWTGIELNELENHIDEVKEVVKQREASGGTLILKKFQSDTTTIPKIKKYLQKKISQGIKPDIILLDYIDCVQPSKRFDDNNVAEGNIMREFESMLYELDIAGWTCVQGNRSSIKSEIVESDQIGGSIKKGQIGHFIMSIAKSLEQKENGRANVAILKSRFGKDGITFMDVLFDNKTIQIDISDTASALTFTQKKQVDVKNEQDYVNQVLSRARQRINDIDEI